MSIPQLSVIKLHFTQGPGLPLGSALHEWSQMLTNSIFHLKFDERMSKGLQNCSGGKGA